MTTAETKVSSRSEEEEEEEYLFKIIVLGDKGCGKTSLIKRLVNNQFSPQYHPTVSVVLF